LNHLPRIHNGIDTDQVIKEDPLGFAFLFFLLSVPELVQADDVVVVLHGSSPQDTPR